MVLTDYYVPTKADIPKMQKMWVKAFMDYPLFTWMMPDKAEREKCMPLLLEPIIKFGLKFGRIMASSSNLEGVIVYSLPESQPETDWTWIRSGMLRAIIRLKRADHKRMMYMNRQIEHVRAQQAPKPHIYLMTGAVTPDKQSQGIGSNTLAKIMADLSSSGIPCYGETFHERNAQIYERIGLKLVGKFPIANTPLVLYAHVYPAKNLG